MVRNAGYISGALLVFALHFVACGDDSGDSVSGVERETVIRDTVVVHDTVFVHDTDGVNVVDSTRIVDSLHVIDSVRVVENVIDSLNIIDSLNVIDSVNVVDSLNIVDSVVVRDSIAVRDVNDILGKCTSEIADTIREIVTDGKTEYFVCDGRILLWHTPTALDWNNKYVRESSVEAFVPLETVLAGLADGEKVVAVLRHAERGEDYSTTGPLNDNGVAQALSLGQKLQGDMDIYYAASPSTRTHQTCNNIAKARGDADTLADTLDFLGGTWFVKDTTAYNKYKDEHSGSWNVTTKWLYENAYADAFYEVAPRSTEYLDDKILPAFEKSGKRYGIFVSHDLLIIPLVSYFSKNRIDLKYYSTKKWLNYLAGVAIVLKPDGSRRFYAVKGLDAGTMKKE